MECGEILVIKRNFYYFVPIIRTNRKDDNERLSLRHYISSIINEWRLVILVKVYEDTQGHDNVVTPDYCCPRI